MSIPSLPPGPRGRRLLLAAALACACLLAGLLAYRLFLSAALRESAHNAARRLDFYGLSLEATLARYEALPGLLALDRHLFELLAHPDNPGRYLEANAYLKTAQAGSDVRVAYLIAPDGRTVAASNWDETGSFVGHNYAFRPYFRTAAAGKLGRFYGVGATTGEPGYFLAAPLREGDEVRGVVTIKVSLAAFEQALARSGDTVLLADAAGVIFLSPDPAWRYRTLAPLADTVRAELGRTRQYGESALRPLLATQTLEGESLRLPGSGLLPRALRVSRRKVGALGWQLVLLSDTADARRGALAAGAATAFACAFLVALAAHLRLRRRRRRELRRLHDQLEERIAARTADLTEKVAALQRTEAILRETRDAAVQTGKLAVLGQMSAGMSHELNQPLAALQTFSDNAATLLEMGRIEDVRDNLAMIRELTARMGRIVTQLRSFSRKGPAERRAVPVARALDNALLIVESRRREIGAEIRIAPIAADLSAAADPTRLEQVLVNLLRNGLDAMQGQPSPCLHLAAEAVDGRVRIAIRDEGPGIPPETQPHLFEPFYTTKPVGEGLGLGLALSLAIVEGFGGQLEAANAPEGGAVFTVQLDASPTT